MEPAALLRRARLDAGLTQTELARRLGVSQPAVAALERPGANPKIRTLERALAAVGSRLRIDLDRSPAIDESQVIERLRLTPAERLDLFQRSQSNLQALVRGARHVAR
jgi:transcriptional regulator with XRE-family HTH domain